MATPSEPDARHLLATISAASVTYEADRAALLHVIESLPPGMGLPSALWGACAVLLWQREQAT